MFGTNKFPTVLKDSGMPSMFRQALGDSTLTFTSCLCSVLRSARVESLAPLGVFLEHVVIPRHENGPIHKGDLLDSQEHVRAFQSPMVISLPSFSFNFLGGLLFVPVLFAASGGHKINPLLFIVFHKCLKKSLLCTL